MSQAGILNRASGPVPPTVATQYTADDSTIGVPVANNYNILSRDTTQDNPNGIKTTVDPNGSDNHYVELTNRITGSITTTDATPTNVFTPSFTLNAAAATYLFEFKVAVYDVTNNTGAVNNFLCGIRTTAGVPVFLVPTDSFLGVEVGNPAVINYSLTGNTLNVVVTGAAATTMNWVVVATYTVAT